MATDAAAGSSLVRRCLIETSLSLVCAIDVWNIFSLLPRDLLTSWFRHDMTCCCRSHYYLINYEQLWWHCYVITFTGTLRRHSLVFTCYGEHTADCNYMYYVGLPLTSSLLRTYSSTRPSTLIPAVIEAANDE